MPATRSRRALVADDDPQIGNLVREILTQDGYDVDVFNDGAAALQAADRGGYALLILDILMPHMTGIEIAQELRERNQGVPIVLMSSFSADEVLKAFNGIRHVAFLQKPFGLSNLRDAVGKVLGRVPC